MFSQWLKMPVILLCHTILMVAGAQNLPMSSTTPTLVHSSALAAASNSLNNCSIVKGLFESQGINAADIPIQPITGKFQQKKSRIFLSFTSIFSYAKHCKHYFFFYCAKTKNYRISHILSFFSFFLSLYGSTNIQCKSHARIFFFISSCIV